MFVCLAYNGPEPSWAKALRESEFARGLGIYSPGIALEDQVYFIEGHLANRRPNALAYANSEALRLDSALWLELDKALPTLCQADHCLDTHQMLFRDLYFLVRADVLIVEGAASNGLAVMANLMGIPVVAISYSPAGIHPWLAYCAQVTVNSPTNVSQILDVLPYPLAQAPEETEEEAPEEVPEPSEPEEDPNEAAREPGLGGGALHRVP